MAVDVPQLDPLAGKITDQLAIDTSGGWSLLIATASSPSAPDETAMARAVATADNCRCGSDTDVAA